jgi:hypothetical protein
MPSSHANPKIAKLPLEKASRRLVKRFFRPFAVASMLAAATILPLKKAAAEGENPKPQVAGKILAGVAGKGTEQFGGVGLSGNFNLGPVNLDASSSVAATLSGKVLSQGELDITVPLAKRFLLSATAFAYTDTIMYGVEYAAGGAFHIGNLTLSSEWENGNAVPVVAFYKLQLGRVTVIPKLGAVVNRDAMIAELKAAARISDRVSGQLQVFTVTKPAERKLAAANVLVGLSFSLGR